MADSLAISTFRIEVTPPLGSWICGGLSARAERVLEPLWLRGLVLHANGTRYVVAVIDFCYLIGRSQRRFEEALAAGAGVPVTQVVLQSNHTHAAPMLNEEAHAIVRQFRPELDFHDESYVSRLLDRTREAVAAARQAEPATVGGVGFASHAVEQFASTRRVRMPDGSIGIRWSFCGNPAIRVAPEGLTDPLLDQVTLFDPAGKPLAALNFYASHPQVGYLPGLIHGDTIGVAMPIFEQTFPGVFPLYFDGCGGDVTGGKYNSGNPWRDRLAFGVRLFDAMAEAQRKVRPRPLESVGWLDRTADCPLAPVQFTDDQIRQVLANPASAGSDVYLYAIKEWRRRDGIDRYPFRLTRLTLGGVALLFLPSELCIEYQLAAKRLYRGNLAVAAYGDAFLDYVATDEAFAEGGYEVEPIWTEVAPGIEPFIKTQLAEVLGAGAPVTPACRS